MKPTPKISRYLKRMRIPALAAAIAGLSIWGGNFQKQSNENTSKTKTQLVTKDTLGTDEPKSVKNPVLEIKYHTDTLAQAGSTLMLYFNGQITRYYVENNNGFRMQMPYFAHEEWHRHNDEIKYRFKYYYTPLEYYKLCMHDEISANMAALLTARYEYLAAATNEGRREIISRYKDTYLKFYFEAVEKGKIKPGSINKNDIEAERKFIANGTKKMWMEKFSRHYSPTTYRMLQRYVGRLGLVKNSGKSYNYVLKQMYTIGGVNFAEYFDEDIYPHDDKAKLAEQLGRIKTMCSGGLEFMDIVNANYGLMQKVNIENTTEAFQHLLISSQLKYLLRQKTSEELEQNPQLVHLTFRKILNEVHHDKSFLDAVREFPLVAEDRFNIKAPDVSYAQVLRQMYTFKGTDLSGLIPEFQKTSLPIRSHFEAFFVNNFYPFYMSPLALANLDKAISGKTELPLGFPLPLSKLRPDTANKTTPAVEPRAKQRISADQYLRIPNLREPLLTSAQKEDYEQIFACIREFESYPQVLKGCNTEAQEEYLRKHKEQRDSLLRFKPRDATAIGAVTTSKQR